VRGACAYGFFGATECSVYPVAVASGVWLSNAKAKKRALSASPQFP
jgi:hypothetical protein